MLVADDPHEADDLAAHHMKEIFESVDRHYGFSDGHLSSVKGYEYYGKLAKTYTKLNADAEARAKAAAFYRNLHAAGTPEQVLEKFRYIHDTVAFGHQSATFRIGTLPFPKMERSFKLFAEKVMPVLQHDPAFQVPAEMEEHAEAVH